MISIIKKIYCTDTNLR